MYTFIYVNIYGCDSTQWKTFEYSAREQKWVHGGSRWRKMERESYVITI